MYRLKVFFLHAVRKMTVGLSRSVDPCKQPDYRLTLSYCCHYTESVFNLGKNICLLKDLLSEIMLLANTYTHSLQLYGLMPVSHLRLLLFIMNTSARATVGTLPGSEMAEVKRRSHLPWTEVL